MWVFLSRFEDVVQKICGAVIAIIFASMVVVGGLQVFNRFVLNVSLAWSEEYQRYSQAWLVFLAIPYAYARAHHIGMEFLVALFPERVRGMLGIGVDLTWAVLGLILVFSGARIVTLGMAVRSAGMGVSMSVVYSVILISGTYILFLATRRLLERLHRAGSESGT